MSVLMILCVVAFSLNSVCTRFFQIKFRNSESNLPLYQTFFCIIAAVLFLFSGKAAIPTWNTVVSSVLFGVFFFGAVYCSSLGFALGSMALTSIITNMSLLIPVLYSLLLLSEPFSFFYPIGILLFFATFFLSSGVAGSKKLNFRWLICAVLAFACNGLSAVVQKQYTVGSVTRQDHLFMAIAYFTAGICFSVHWIVVKRRQPSPITKRYFAGLVGISALSGIGSFGGNLLLTHLSDKIGGGVLYPCINGGISLLLTVVSCVIFREKLTVRTCFALLFGIAAIVVLNLA